MVDAEGIEFSHAQVLQQFIRPGHFQNLKLDRMKFYGRYANDRSWNCSDERPYLLNDPYTQYKECLGMVDAEEIVHKVISKFKKIDHQI